MRIDSTTTPAEIEAAHRDVDAEILSPDGEHLTTLYCPHCDLWIGDPDHHDADVARLSTTHDVGRCDAAREDRIRQEMRIGA